MKKKIKNGTPVRSVKRTHPHNPFYVSVFGVVTVLLLSVTFALIAYKPHPVPSPAQTTAPAGSLGPKKGMRWIDTPADLDNLRNKPIVLRDAYSTHFKNDDGTVTALFTGFKQNYEVAPGVWEPIDYSLEKSKDPRYDYQTKNGVGIYLSRNGTVARKENDLFLEAGAPTLGLFNPTTQSFVKLNNLDNAKITKDSENNSLVLDGKDVKLVVYAYDLGAREDLILENNSLVQNASDEDLLTLKAPLTTSGKLLLNNHELSTNNYELTQNDTLVLTENDKIVTFPFPEGHDANQNKAEIRRFLIKEGDSWYLYTSLPVTWLKKPSTSYPVTVDPDWASNAVDAQIMGSSASYSAARGNATNSSTTLIASIVGQNKSGSTYTVYRTYLKFDTSSLADAATINQVNAKLYVTEDTSTTDFDVYVVSYNWSAEDPVSSLNRATAYSNCLAASTAVLWRNTSGISVGNSYSSNNLATDWVNKTGTTYYCVQSNKDRAESGTQPTGAEYIKINSTGSNYLTITYTNTPTAPTSSAATNVAGTSFSANWGSQAATGADAYTLDVATDNGFTSFVATGCGGGSCNAKAVGNVTTYSVTGLTGSTTYYYRVRATDTGGGGTSGNSGTINLTTSATAPPAPTANAASSVTDTSMSANWSASAGATNYKLSVSTVAGCTSGYVTACGGSSCNLFVTGDVTTYGLTSLSANTTYYYCLKATNANGDSALSNVTTQVTAPAAPTVSAGTSITSTGFSANWSKTTGATTYYLDVANDSGFTSYTGAVATACGGASCQNKNVGDVATYAVTPLSGGTTYYYRVRAYSTNGTSNNSGTTIITTVPAVPTVNPGVAVDTVSTSTGGPATSLTWSHTVSGSNRLLVVGVTMRAYQTISSVTYAGTGLTKSGAVQAGTGNNPRTEIWYSKDFEPTTGTNNIIVTPSGSEYMEAGAISFTGVYQTTPLGPFASNYAASGSPSTVAVTSATGDIVLDVLKFWNGSGESTKDASQTQRWYLSSDGGHKGGGSTKAGAGSVTMSWTRTDNNAWSHAGVSVKSYQSSISTTGFSANWSASTGATKYYLDVAKDSGFTNFTTPLDTACGGASCNNKDVGNVTTYDVGANLTAGTAYYYRVRAYNASGTSTSSSIITLYTGPTANNASNVYSGNLQANWTAVTGATSYELDVATSADFSTGFVSGYNPATGITANYKMVPGLTPNTPYYYRVRFIKGGVTSGNSSTISKTTKPASPTSITASPVNSSNFTVSWTAPSGGASSYKLDVATDSTFTKFAPDASYGSWQNVTATSPRVVNNLFPGTLYYFRVRAVNTDGLTSSNPTSATPSATTAAASGGEPCQSVDSTNTTINYSCTFLNAYDGIGNGNLAVASGKTLTLNNNEATPNQTIIWTPGKKIDLTGGGSIVINTGASLKQGYLTYPDADSDGYPDSLTPTFATSIAGGYKARYQLNGGYTLDCDANTTTGGGGGNDCNTKTVFVTNTAYTGSLGGLNGADDKCNTAATNAGLTGYYRAWLSDGSTSAATRLNHFGYKYQLVNGTDVAYGWTDLIDGSLQNAINKDEYGGTFSANTAVWTNTNSNGSASTNHCSTNWSSTSGSGGQGNIDATTGGEWTNLSIASCSTSGVHLVCLEQ